MTRFIRARAFLTLGTTGAAIIAAIGLVASAAPPADAQERPARETVAINAFTNNSGLPRFEYLGKALSDMLVTDLSRSAVIRVVERDRLQELLKELRLSETSFIDPRTAQRLGKGLGASHVVVGSFTVIEGVVRIDARVLRTETSEVTMAETVEGPMPRFLELEKALGRSLLGRMNVRLTAQEDTAFQRPVTTSLEALEQYGQALVARDRGEDVPARDHLQAAASLDPNFDRAKQLLGDLEADIRRVITREYTDRAVTFLQRGLPEQARRELDQAIRLNPRDGRAYFLRAYATSGGDRSQAEVLADLDRAIANGHRTPKSYGSRGDLRDRMGDDEGAVRDYEAALRSRVDPTVILTEGLDYDEPPMGGDVTVGRLVFSLGVTLVDLGQVRRAQRVCEQGIVAISGRYLQGLQQAEIERVIVQPDEPRTAKERAAVATWAQRIDGVPDLSWPTLCIGWAIAGEMERSQDVSLAPVAKDVLEGFLENCLSSRTGNDLACRGTKGWGRLQAFARGLLYDLELQHPIRLDSIVPIDGHTCLRSFDRMVAEARTLLPSEWSVRCLQEIRPLADSLGARTASGADEEGMVRYLDLLARRGSRIAWDEVPTEVMQVALTSLASARFRRRETPEGCRWYAELGRLGLATASVEPAARRAACAAPSGTAARRTSGERITFAPSVAASDRTVLSAILPRLLIGIEQARGVDSLEALLLLTDAEKEGLQRAADDARRSRESAFTSRPEACRRVERDLIVGFQSVLADLRDLRDAAERGRFRLQVVSATRRAVPPSACPLELGLDALGGEQLQAEVELLWPVDRGGGRLASHLSMRLFRFGDGPPRLMLRIDDPRSLEPEGLGGLEVGMGRAEAAQHGGGLLPPA